MTLCPDWLGEQGTAAKAPTGQRVQLEDRCWPRAGGGRGPEGPGRGAGSVHWCVAGVRHMCVPDTGPLGGDSTKGPEKGQAATGHVGVAGGGVTETRLWGWGSRAAGLRPSVHDRFPMWGRDTESSEGTELSAVSQARPGPAHSSQECRPPGSNAAPGSQQPRLPTRLPAAGSPGARTMGSGSPRFP